MNNENETSNNTSICGFNLNSNKETGEDDDNYTYTATQVIGSGSFGVVYQAIIVETGEKVAIKKVFQDKRYKNRELQMLKELNHPNVVKMKKYFYTAGETNDEIFLNVVMDFIPDTLSKVVKGYFKSKVLMPMFIVKLYAYQMLRGLAYISSIGICHRDIKPQNVLVNSSTYELRICDFGSAKKLSKGEPNISYICSRYYRAPELIFGSTDYTTNIDIWSTACVIAEMVLGQPLFPGDSAVDQIVQIIKILGTPNKSQIQAMNPNYKEYRFPIIKPLEWSKVFKGKTDDAYFIDLIGKLLVYEPQKRLKPFEALGHPFFNDLRDVSSLNKNFSMFLFNWTEVERKTNSAKLIESLTPKWLNK